jgi:hypothetical protein
MWAKWHAALAAGCPRSVGNKGGSKEDRRKNKGMVAAIRDEKSGQSAVYLLYVSSMIAMLGRGVGVDSKKCGRSGLLKGRRVLKMLRRF